MGRFARICVTTATLAVALVTAGCSDDPDPDDDRRTVVDASRTTKSTPAEEPAEDIAGEAPAAAYSAWINALARHDAAAACALQAPEFTIELRYDAILVDRAELGDPCTGFEAILWEDPDFDSEIVDISTTQVTEEDAILEVHLADDAQTVTMTYHRAAWRVLKTERRADADGAVATWLDAWCRLDPSMSREQIIELMGEPSGEYTVADGGEPQLWWARDQYDFRVYLDVDGSVLELVGDYDALSAADRALLPCPELRN
jgi:hypothetical protein